MKLASAKECSACMACIDACNHNVLKTVVDSDGYYKIDISNQSACVECGLCSKVCPILNRVDTRKNDCLESYAVWAKDDKLRYKCASGGAFGAIAEYIINKGGVAYGAAIDKFRIRHRRATNLHELQALLGSKYQHSELTGVYKEVKKDLLSGKIVLFSGLSCQIAGLIKFLGSINRSNLITLDTICGGLSTMLPMISLEKSGKYSGIHSFRDKVNGWQPVGFKYSLKMDSNDGHIIDLGLDNHVLNTFSSKLLKRYNCLTCKFNGLDRSSDITIGDYWGDTTLPNQHSLGLSVAIVRSKKASDIIRQVLNYQTTDLNAIIAGNPNLVKGHYPLVRYLPSRVKALKLQSEGKFDMAWKYMSPHSFNGLILRLAIKISTILK